MNVLVLVLALQQLDIDPRLRTRAGLIDTLNQMACRSAVFVRIQSSQFWRGSTIAGEIWVGAANDERALVHEFGHWVAMTAPRRYIEWADSMGLDPWRKQSQESFAEAFVGAVTMLYAAQRNGWPADDSLPPQPGKRKKGEDYLARRFARRRPFRRRKDDVDLDPWCSPVE